MKELGSIRYTEFRSAVGQDSHAFDFRCPPEQKKPLILGGVNFSVKYPELPGLSANSDGDVVLHAITNAVSGITCRNILGKPADEMCRAGITDSREYLKAALADLEEKGYGLVNVSVSIECKKPKITPLIEEMRESISEITRTDAENIGITATTGEELSSFGRGEGIAVICIITVGK